MAEMASSASGGLRLKQRGGSRAGRGRPLLKLAVFAVVLLGLGAVIGFSVSRELSGAGSSSIGSQPLRIAQRPALSAEEQAYVDGLWPIHTQLEVAAERVALGAIFYKSDDLDRTELRARLEQALSSYRTADGKLRELRPPPSMQSAQAGYLTAASLFEESAVEMLKMFDDGSDDHLLTAYPVYLDGTNKIRDLGGRFWPDEFPPN